jgi:hypothetical protein
VSFLPGYGIRAFLNGYAVSGQINGATASHRRSYGDATVATTTGGMSWVPGLKSGSLTLKGPFDGAAALQAQITAAIGVDNSVVVTVLPDGDAVGKPALFCAGDASEYAVDANVADTVGYSFGALADDSVDMGWSLLPNSAITITTTGTAVDRGTVSTPSTGGLAAALHVTAYSGFTNVAFKVQHSPDNSSWADLASFTAVTAIGAQRAQVANGTTVNRYLRAVATVTGVGSITPLVVVAPR